MTTKLPTTVVTGEMVLGWFEQAWDHSVFHQSTALYPDAHKCQLLAGFLNSIARIEAKPVTSPPALPAMVEHGRKFLKNLPMECKKIEAELALFEADTDNAYRDALILNQNKILADLLSAERAVKATLAHWGVPRHKLNPAKFIFDQAKMAWEDTMRFRSARKIKIPLSANEGSPMTMFLQLALAGIGIEGYEDHSIIAAATGKRHLARRHGGSVFEAESDL
jgi:hypothetical protein